MEAIQPTTAPPTPDADGEQPIIRTRGLTKVYEGADFAAVDGLDLSVRRGEIFGLLGPQRRRQDDDGGNAHDARDPDFRQRSCRRRRRGRAPGAGQAADRDRLPDEHARPAADGAREPVLPRAPVRDRGGRVASRIADELLEQFHLSKWADASVFALSGGMAQRLMVARAIFHRPAVLFMDEPTAGLDPQSRLALWEILGELHAAGQTILLTTHYMEEADQLCTAWRSWTTAGSWPSTRRRRSSGRWGRTRSSTVKAARRAGALAEHLAAGDRGRHAHAADRGRRRAARHRRRADRAAGRGRRRARRL